MNRLIQTQSARMILFLLFSFTNRNEVAGTYGVPDVRDSQVKLTIRTDNTFEYRDFSDAVHPISISGQWTQKGKKVFLNSSNSREKFHNVWTISENGEVVRSQSGSAVYRLCRIGGEGV